MGLSTLALTHLTPAEVRSLLRLLWLLWRVSPVLCLVGALTLAGWVGAYVWYDPPRMARARRWTAHAVRRIPGPRHARRRAP